MRLQQEGQSTSKKHAIVDCMFSVLYEYAQNMVIAPLQNKLLKLFHY